MDKKKSAKMEMLKKLRKMAMDMNGEGLGGMEDMQKVSVMAKDKEGLKEGLEKAEEVLEKGPMAMGEEKEEEEDEMEEEKDYENMSRAELLECIKKMDK